MTITNTRFSSSETQITDMHGTLAFGCIIVYGQRFLCIIDMAANDYTRRQNVLNLIIPACGYYVNSSAVCLYDAYTLPSIRFEKGYRA